MNGLEFWWCTTCGDRFAAARPECPIGGAAHAVIDYDEHFMQQLQGVLRQFEEKQIAAQQRRMDEFAAELFERVKHEQAFAESALRPN